MEYEDALELHRKVQDSLPQDVRGETLRDLRKIIARAFGTSPLQVRIDLGHGGDHAAR